MAQTPRSSTDLLFYFNCSVVSGCFYIQGCFTMEPLQLLKLLWSPCQYTRAVILLFPVPVGEAK